MSLQIYTKKIQARRVKSVGRCEGSEINIAARMDGQVDLGHAKNRSDFQPSGCQSKDQRASETRDRMTGAGD